ncbi:MAG TPA: TIM barrel protein [Candidatus Acidoferrum sp.]|nr:TIM barrel protein [Candidatus Acidoferrum sp.]
MNSPVSRRSAVTRLASSTAAVALATSLGSRLFAADTAAPGMKGRVNHSVCKWCYPNIPLDDLCKAGKEFGLTSVELLSPGIDFETLKKHGLTCAMVGNPTVGPDRIGRIEKAWNRVEHHDRLVEAYEKRIKEVADAGFTNLICFSGNRDGLDDQKGIENCALGLKRIMSAAEKAKVTIVMELLNSRVNHKDYQCDHTEWGVDLCKAIGSERFKLLYDIYHMQIMEGDLIVRIKKFNPYIAHYHTGGVPGRNEIDESQEINYPAVMKAIVETGYKGHVAQEFIPKRADKIASLKQGVQICDV